MQLKGYALAIGAIVVVASVSLIGFNQIIGSADNSTLNFYVFSDSQGYQGGIIQIAEIANLEKPDFVFHCGDLTPFGQPNQYEDVISALETFSVPVYTTVGNHDIREGGNERYLENFDSPTYSFDSGPAHFTVFNTSTGDVSETEMMWLENDLSQSSSEIKFVFTHIPLFDPRAGQDHALMNTTTAEQLMTLFEAQDVNTVFSGHIHMYNESVRNGVRYVITGGAGASLYASEEEGGIHHFMNITVTENGVEIAPVLLPPPSLERDIVVVRGSDEDVTLSLTDLNEMNMAEGWSSFQNQLNNWRGYGLYQGVKVSDLVELIGDMTVTDIVRVTSFDGYSQEFSYWNVYPNSSWYSIQGDMILAYRLNGTDVLDWTDGMRLVMLPADEAYSNDDCLATSFPGMGCQIYLSAGARWVRFVSFIEVISN
jgi:3',5'-cyclic AMP phosphodiesterase CpdA